MLAEVSPGDAWLNFLGALHPVLVHFPIALAVVAAIVESWRAIRRDPGLSPFACTAVTFAALSAVATATSGWFNAVASDDAASGGLFLHRWSGICAASLLVGLALSAPLIRRMGTARALGAWRSSLLLCVGIVSVAGWYGGNLVYGDGHLTDPLWKAIDSTERSQRVEAEADARAQLGWPPAEVANAEATSVPQPTSSVPDGTLAHIDFSSQILPIFESRCYECHGRGKKKGGVRLDDLARVTCERDGEWVVKPGDPSASLLIRMVSMPSDSDERMPPEGDPLTEAQIALLSSWISEGAKSPAVPATPSVSSDRWSVPERTITQEDFATIELERTTLRRLGIDLRPISAGSSSYELDASHATQPVTDAEIERIAASKVLASIVVSLNATRSALTESCAQSIAQMTNLREIRVDFTAVGDAVADAAATLPHLEAANFVSTQLTDGGIEALAKSKSLRRLFVWKSRVTPMGVSKFREACAGVRLVDGA